MLRKSQKIQVLIFFLKKKEEKGRIEDRKEKDFKKIKKRKAKKTKVEKEERQKKKKRKTKNKNKNKNKNKK